MKVRNQEKAGLIETDSFLVKKSKKLNSKFLKLEIDISEIKEDIEDIKNNVDNVISESTLLVNETSYDNLLVLISQNSLVVGTYYIINDYQSTYKIPYTDTLVYGDLEPIIVKAIANNKIDLYAYSLLYTEDILYYSLYADVNEFPDAVKGWIYRRIDTYKNVDMPYDFRNIKFRRWKVSAPEYSSTKLYAARDVCMNNNILYVSVNNNNINQSLTNRDYFYPLGMPNGGYIGLTSSSSASPKVAGLSFTIDANDYRDYFTFERYDLTQNVYQEIPTGLETLSEKRLEWCNNIFFENVGSIRIGQRVSGNTFMKMCNNVNFQLASYYNLFVGTFTNCFDITHFRYMWVDGGFNMNVCPYEFSYSVIVRDPAVSGTTPAIGWCSFGYVNNSFFSLVSSLNDFGDIRDSNLTGELYYNKGSFGLFRLKLHNVRKANFGAGVAAITLKNSTQGVNISAGAIDINFPDGVKEINVMALGTLGLDLSQINFASYNSKDISNTTKTIESVSSTKVKLIYSDPNDGSISFVLLEKAIKSYTSITAPTFNNTNKTYTIPTLEGIEYYVDNVLKTAGTYSVNPGTLVFIEAKPITNYSIRHKVLKMWQYQMT